MSDDLDPQLRNQLHALADEATEGLQPPSAAGARARGDRIRTRRRVAAVGVVAAVLIAGVGAASAVLPATVAPPPIAATPSTGPVTSTAPSPQLPRLSTAQVPNPDELGEYGGSGWELDPDELTAEADCLEQILAPTAPVETVEQRYRLVSSEDSGSAIGRAVTAQYVDDAAARAAWEQMVDFGRVCRNAHETALDDRQTLRVDGPFPVGGVPDGRYVSIPYVSPDAPNEGTFHLVGMVRSGSRIGLVEMQIRSQDLIVSDTEQESADTGVPLNPMWPTLRAYGPRLG